MLCISILEAHLVYLELNNHQHWFRCT